MAIHPQYADAILEGCKRVEFRKRPLADDVTRVIIYATAPVKRIIGEFTVDRTLVASPSEIWDAVGSVGAIDAEPYAAYYSGATMAAAILVKGARRYPEPIALQALTPMPAVPQSFSYLSDTHLAQIGDRTVEHGWLLSRLATGLRSLVLGAVSSRTVAAFAPTTDTEPETRASPGGALSRSGSRPA